MKKILVITTRNPYSGRHSGDVIGSLKIINFLKKKNKVDVVTLGKKKLNIKNILFFDQPNYLLQILYVFSSFLKMKPLQFGLFFSQSMKRYIEEHAKNYDLLFFYHIRSSQYLPKNYDGNKIIEMGDLYSQNYFQTFRNLNLLNPLKYIYLIESFLVKNIEKKIFLRFDKIILFSKSEIIKISKQFRKKIFYINLSVNLVQNKFSFSYKNNRILFIGNLGYLPNFLAVKDFIKNILPSLRKKIPNIEFCIIGNISKFDKFFLSFHQNIKILGQKKNIMRYIKNSFCGLANLKIATGVQGKVLTYMSHGLPVICSKKVASNFVNKVINYDNDIELIEKISYLKNNKKLSNKLSKRSLQFVKNLSEDKICLQYLKIIKFSKKPS
jgi:polysaccharide biosynthesis protein PslH